MELPLARFVQPWVLCEHSSRGENTVWIYDLELNEPPLIQVDGLEIVEVEWLTPEQALARELTSHLREYMNDVA